LRVLITQAFADDVAFIDEIEADKNYFGGRRKGKRGQESGGIPAFGILKHAWSRIYESDP